MAGAEGEMAGNTAAEDFMVWKTNTPVLYDLVISHPLEWPSLTVQWLPSSSSSTAAAGRRRLILGTHTSDDAPNFLMVADVNISPSADVLVPGPAAVVEISKSIPHAGEVNRARFMPQKPALVATKTCGREVHVFDVGREGECLGPKLVLRGHSTEGYGISWSPFREGLLLSGSYDSKICLWDVGKEAKAKTLDALDVFEAHKEAIEDVAWHLKDENMFGSVGDDHLLLTWDFRSPKKPLHSIVAHEDEVNSLSFNPFNEWILATASADSTINLFDLRNLTTSLHTFDSHAESVLQVEWSPKHETVFASSSADKRLMVWDISRIGEQQLEEDAEDGPPELLFVHGGHTAKISDFSWSPDEPWLISSVAENNILQVWQMAESIYHDDYNAQGDADQ